MTSPGWLFCGGGTGGHLTPGIAVAQELREGDADCRILFAVSARPGDARMLARAEFDSVALPFEPPRMRRPFRTARILIRSLRAAKKLVADFAPTTVIGLGGYASLPGVFAASKRCPIVLLEQNVIPGRANLRLARYADRICVSFAESTDRFPAKVRSRCVVTGNPVRREVAEVRTATLSEGEQEKTLLVLGGSGGSSAVNQLALNAIRELRTTSLAGWRVLHQTGHGEAAQIQNEYAAMNFPATVVEFCDDLPNWYAEANLAICRGGATTLAEIACASLPAIVIPFPAAKDDHQTANALWYEERGGVVTIAESAAAAVLTDEVRRVASSDSVGPTLAAAMSKAAMPNAAKAIADLLARVR